MGNVLSREVNLCVGQSEVLEYVVQLFFRFEFVPVSLVSLVVWRPVVLEQLACQLHALVAGKFRAGPDVIAKALSRDVLELLHDDILQIGAYVCRSVHGPA